MKLATCTPFVARAALVLGTCLVGTAVMGPDSLLAQDTSKMEKPVKPERVKRGGAYLVLEAEIRAATADNAYDLLRQLRPAMLRARAGNQSSDGSGTGIVVYSDNVRLGGTESLKNLDRMSIREIRFVNAGDATQLFGTGHPSGAILVFMKR